MQPRIRIRAATRRDLDRILDIEAVCFGRDAWHRRMFLDAFAECGDLFFIATVGRKIAGYSITCVERNTAELVSIAVLPQFRRGGVARALLSATLDQLVEIAPRAVRLMVGVDNVAAISLYRRLGFVRIRTVSDYYGEGRHAWRMEQRGSTPQGRAVSARHTRPDKRPRTEPPRSPK